MFKALKDRFKIGRPAVTPAVTPVVVAPVRIAVDSQVIKSVGFQRVNGYHGVLEIEFVSGAMYAYDDVPQGLYDDLLDAASVGSFYNRKIKPFYTGRKIDA